MKRRFFSALALVTAVAVVGLPATAARAKSPSKVVPIGFAALAQSQDSGSPIPIGKGYTALYQPGWSDEDVTLARTIPTMTIEIVLDGVLLPTESAITDLGIVCDAFSGTEVCLDSARINVTASSHPLKRGLHTLTYRWSFSEPGTSPFGYTWEAGVAIEITGTLAAA